MGGKQLNNISFRWACLKHEMAKWRNCEMAIYFSFSKGKNICHKWGVFKTRNGKMAIYENFLWFLIYDVGFKWNVFVQASIGFWNSIFGNLGHLRHIFFPFEKLKYIAISCFKHAPFWSADQEHQVWFLFLLLE